VKEGCRRDGERMWHFDSVLKIHSVLSTQSQNGKGGIAGMKEGAV
jgi:hypothetical protein